MKATIHNGAEQERIAGALACVDQLRALIEATQDFAENCDSAEWHYARQRVACEKFAAAFGPMDPRLEGAMLALAEYIYFNEETGQPNLDHGGWMPMASMTEAERQNLVYGTQNWMDEVDAELPKTNVIQLSTVADRRPAQ